MLAYDFPGVSVLTPNQEQKENPPVKEHKTQHCARQLSELTLGLDDIIQPSDLINTGGLMGYTKSIDHFLEGWYERVQAYKEVYSGDALSKEFFNLVLTISSLCISMYTASGNLYVLANTWTNLSHFQVSVAIVSLCLALLVTVIRVLNFQENSIRGLHAATSLASIAHDILLNQSLCPEKRLYAGIFIQNIVKRTEAVLNLAYPVKNVKEKPQKQHFAHIHRKQSNAKPNVTFQGLLKEVEDETGISPHKIFSKAHIHTHLNRDHVYLVPSQMPPLSPPIHMREQLQEDLQKQNVYC